MNTMQQYLTFICNKGDDNGVQIGLVFKTGQMQTGALRISRMLPAPPGNAVKSMYDSDIVMYEFCTAGEVGDEKGKRKPAVFSYFFTADAVERIVVASPLEPRLIST